MNCTPLPDPSSPFRAAHCGLAHTPVRALFHVVFRGPGSAAILVELVRAEEYPQEVSTWLFLWPHLSLWSRELTVHPHDLPTFQKYPPPPLSHHCGGWAFSFSCGRDPDIVHQAPSLSTVSHASPRPSKSVHNLFFLAVEQMESEMSLQFIKWVLFPSTPQGYVRIKTFI